LAYTKRYCIDEIDRICNYCFYCRLPDDKLKEKANGRKKSNGSDSDKEKKEPEPQLSYFELVNSCLIMQ